MDNLTHSLIGAVLAEGAYQRSPSLRRPTVAPRLRLVFWLVSILGNNLPDLDLVYSWWTFDSAKLGNLIHHRGHTHTLVFVLLQGFLLLGLGRGALRHCWKRLFTWDKAALALLAFAGPFLHIVLDGLNSYGVHPFWPVWNGWLYGDTLFIVEPLLWVSLAPVLYFATTRRRWRRVFEAAAVALLTVIGFVPVVSWYSSLAIVIWAVVGWLLCKTASARGRVITGMVMGTLVVVLFASVSRVSRQAVSKASRELHPLATLLDVELAPLPANPFCWSLITVETFSEGSHYRLRRGIFSPFPSLVSAGSCPRFPSRGTTAALYPVAEYWGKQFAWEGQYQTTVSDLKSYVDLSCDWDAYLRFSRAPFLQEEDGKLWAGDLRYDFDREISFAEIEVPPRTKCQGWNPRWLRPRRDVF